MKNNELMKHSAIIFSFVFAFSVMIIPVSQPLKWLRPDLVSLVLIYWILALPNTVGIFFAFMMGLLFDLVTGLLFGSMGLTLAIVAFLTINLRLRLRIYRYWQKFIVIMLVLACSQLIRLWIQMLIGHPPTGITYWLSSVSSAIIWPLVFIILQTYQRSLKLV